MRMDHEHPPDGRSWWRTRTGWALLAFLGIAGFFLFTEHRAHALGVLPFVLLLLCPLLHLFGHGGHKGPRTPGQGQHPESGRTGA
jgi:hypothetical protein